MTRYNSLMQFLMLAILVVFSAQAESKTEHEIRLQAEHWHQQADTLSAQNVVLQQQARLLATKQFKQALGNGAALKEIIQQGNDASQSAADQSELAVKAIQEQKSITERHTQILNKLVDSNKTIVRLSVLLICSMILDLVLVFMIVKGGRR